MRSTKIILALAFLVSIASAFKFIAESTSDSLSLIGHDYAYREDFAEKNYNGYQVYEYYLWLDSILPANSQYGLLVSKDDDRSYGRYLHRMNYFLYPRHIIETGSPRYLFAPKLSTYPGRTGYRLKERYEGAGVFVKK